MSGVCSAPQRGLLWEDWNCDAKRSSEKETCNYMTLDAKDDKLTLKVFVLNDTQFDELVLIK